MLIGYFAFTIFTLVKFSILAFFGAPNPKAEDEERQKDYRKDIFTLVF